MKQLRQMLRRIEQEREVAARRRRKRLLGIGIGISVLAHLILLAYFASLYRGGDGDGFGLPTTYEVAILPSEQLSDLDETNLDDLLSEEPEAIEGFTLDEPAVLSEANTPAGELEAAGGGAPTLGGTGGTAGDTPLGGAGTTYFGVSARGNRFAFIVDRSGSMSGRNRMKIAMDELIGAIEGLPDYTYFTVVLFSSDMLVPPTQRGWVQARRSNVLQVTRWLRTVSSGGGTLPRSAFLHVFNMDVRPDVIFFMTDGIIASQNLTAEEVASLNRSGKRVVINTIAFGDQGSEEMLRQIARDSGGTYRYVPDGG